MPSEVHGSQDFLDFVERLAAEVRRAQHLGFRLQDQVADIDDVVVLQAVRRTDAEFQFVDLLEQGRIERQLRLAFFNDRCLRLFKGDEDLKLVLQDARRESDGVNRRDSSIGFDFEDQLVVIERLALTGRLDLVSHLLDRRIEGIDGDQADRRVFRTQAVGRHIALAVLDGEFHAHGSALVQRTDDVVGVEDFDISRDIDLTGGHRTSARGAQNHALRTFGVHTQRQLLDVQDDIDDVFADAFDGGEFMHHAVDLDGGDSRALQRGEEYATQRVTEGHAETALQRLRDKTHLARRV